MTTSAELDQATLSSSSAFKTIQLQPLLLSEAKCLLDIPYLPHECGFAINAEAIYHIAASTYMAMQRCHD
jgi:hypothetical protein